MVKKYYDRHNHEIIFIFTIITLTIVITITIIIIILLSLQVVLETYILYFVSLYVELHCVIKLSTRQLAAGLVIESLRNVHIVTVCISKFISTLPFVD